MTRRKALVSTVIAVGLAGAALATVPFLKSLGISAKTQNDSQALHELGEMHPGELRKVARVWIYRRTDQDKRNIDSYTARLADPLSAESRQPNDAKNHWRSANEEFFIFLPYAPIRGCGVKFVPPGGFVYEGHPEAAVAKTIPHFTEDCEGRIFDTSGRLFFRKGYPPEQNLIVPNNIEWLTQTKVLIGPG